MNNLKTDISVDKKNKSINIKRQFNAPLNHVWDAWTKPELLDQWWAPKPYRAETKSMDFSEGGLWLYAMVSPEDEKLWCKANYENIDSHKSFSHSDAFCDETGKENTEKPTSYWTTVFSETNGTTNVNITLKHDSLADVEKMIEMGFKEGLTMALENLDELLQTIKNSESKI